MENQATMQANSFLFVVPFPQHGTLKRFLCRRKASARRLGEIRANSCPSKQSVRHNYQTNRAAGYTTVNIGNSACVSCHSPSDGWRSVNFPPELLWTLQRARSSSI